MRIQKSLSLFFFSLGLICLTSGTSNAQLTYEERIEFELKSGYNADFIVPRGKDGFLIIAENEDSKGKETEWLYDYYNNRLEHEENKTIRIDKKYNSKATFSNDIAEYTLYQHKSNGEFEIVIADKSSKSLDRTKGKLHKKFYVQQMQILEDQAYLVGSLKKSPTVMVVNLKTGLTKILPISVGDYKPKNTSISNFQVKSKANEFLVFVKGVDSRKQSELFMLKGSDGKLSGRDFKLGKTGTKNLISVSASKVGEDAYVITGTYGEETISTSEGIYFGRVDDDRVDFLKFTKFLDMKDFLSYLPEKKQAKIEKKRKRKKAKGKDVKINYLIADHDIINHPDGGYILIGEAYYPTYRTEARTTFVNGQATTTYVTVFDGYQYTHAIVSKFDKEGNLEWDNSFKMFPSYKPYYAKRFITLFGDTDGALNLAFADVNTINTKSISDQTGEILKEKTSEQIETGLEGDKTKYSSAKIEYWYDNYFLIYGSQKIKNKGDSKSNRGKRKVFFVSKVQFDS